MASSSPLTSEARAPGRSTLRWIVAALVLAVALVVPRSGFPEGTAVPGELQVELLSRLSAYDRNFPARAAGTVRVLILVKAGSTRSDVSASSVKSALGAVARVGGLPHLESVVSFDSAAALAKRCVTEHLAIVYVTPGLGAEVEAIRAALTGVDVLTVAGAPEFVPRGIVLGFELLSGKPKMLLNYEQAKRQNVSFSADVLKLMKVVPQ